MPKSSRSRRARRRLGLVEALGELVEVLERLADTWEGQSVGARCERSAAEASELAEWLTGRVRLCRERADDFGVVRDGVGRLLADVSVWGWATARDHDALAEAWCEFGCAVERYVLRQLAFPWGELA